MGKRRTKTEWQRLIDEQAAGDLSQKAFCEQVGVPLSTFGYWRRKLRLEASAGSEGASGRSSVSLEDWIELPAPVRGALSGWLIELDLGGGLCLRLTRG